jgi:aspartate carbamoyltransferase regulatory subunit
MALTVEKIESGTVIDHIRAGLGMRVLQMLGLGSGYSARVALLMNVPSKRIGKKDMLKVEGKHIDEKTIDKIALISPDATINLVKGGEVIEKRQVKVPGELRGAFKCPNPKCISNVEKIDTRFKVEKAGLRCGYCERVFKPDELV